MSNQITGTTRLGGLLGSPVSHSLSPLMYNASFEQTGLDFVYLCFDVRPKELGSVVKAFREMNVYGFNLTMPDKEAVMEWLDDCSRAARLIGAVNTVENRDGKLIGHNTDGIGYMRSLQDAGLSMKGKEMVLLGAGGAAGAIAVQAALDGVSALHLVCRQGKSWDRALQLADTINMHTSCRAQVIDFADHTSMKKALRESALLTNATSAGMNPHPEECPISDFSMLTDNLTVSDIIYHPRRTRLLEEAGKRGLTTIGGLYMLLYQGEAAFRIWTGLQMPTESIRAAYFQ